MTTTPSVALATAIRVELARRNLRQQDLACGIGISEVSVSRRMSGRIEWTISEVEAVARFLNVPFIDLFDVATAS